MMICLRQKSCHLGREVQLGLAGLPVWFSARFPFMRWQPDANQMAWIKAVVFLMCLLPALRTLVFAALDKLGAHPVQAIEHSTGYWALWMLMLTLSLTPVRLLFGLKWSLQLRRMIGLFMFFYACLHVVSYAWLDHWFDWQEILRDIVKHPYVLVGFTAFMLSLPLAVTSNRFMVKKLQSRWKTLHKLVYLIAILGVVHFWWLVKKDITEPVTFAMVLSFLLLIRLVALQRPSSKV